MISLLQDLSQNKLAMRFLLLMFFLTGAYSSVRSQSYSNGLIGDWTLKNNSRVFHVDPIYNHVIEPMSEDKITFYANGTMVMSSGFFYYE